VYSYSIYGYTWAIYGVYGTGAYSMTACAHWAVVIQVTSLPTISS